MRSRIGPVSKTSSQFKKTYANQICFLDLVEDPPFSLAKYGTYIKGVVGRFPGPTVRASSWSRSAGPL
ncbi:hypothetical protein BDN67DRAFT_970268, partial [Paxillus ammoniavirescens]